jgi:hypothetical protein
MINITVFWDEPPSRLVDKYQTTRWHILEERNLSINCRDKIKPNHIRTIIIIIIIIIIADVIILTMCIFIN